MFSAQLKLVSLFRSLPDDQLGRVEAACRIMEQPAGRTIIEEGSSGDNLYMILDGAVRVHKEDFYGGKEVITTLHSGDHFGEVSLFDEAPRSAAVSTIQPSKLLYLSRESLRRLMDDDHTLATAIYENLVADLCNRLRETNEHLIYLMGKKSEGL